MHEFKVTWGRFNGGMGIGDGQIGGWDGIGKAGDGWRDDWVGWLGGMGQDWDRGIGTGIGGCAWGWKK